MADLLRDQKEEANAAFAKFVKANYADWVADADAPARPTLSPDVLRRAVFPRLAAGRRVVLLVLDNFRYDQWRVLAPELAADFDAEEQVYFSILPTATQYARNALFAGMMPLDIARTHPDLWVDEDRVCGDVTGPTAAQADWVASRRPDDPSLKTVRVSEEAH